MSALFVLLLVSLIVAIGFLAAFIWAMRNGQYDDSYTPSIRMLFEDKPKTQNPLRNAEGNTTAEVKEKKHFSSIASAQSSAPTSVPAFPKNTNR